MTEFFLNQECGETQYHDTVLKHHFTFGTYYAPTKFGRSTLRRADYIFLNNNYLSTAERNHLFLIYPLQDGITLTLNDTEYAVRKNQLSSFVLPQGTRINLGSSNPSTILLFECDILKVTPEAVIPFDLSDTSYHTDINVFECDDMADINNDNKHFFGFILHGNVTIDAITINTYDGFFGDKPMKITGNAKILTFSMPIPL